ncbi:MAG: FAD-dependent oxidoreductase, partial [Pseudomonadales bacterium]
YPSCFLNQSFKGRVYRLADMVIDTSSLVANLAIQGEGRIFQCAPRVIAGSDGGISCLQLPGELILKADTYIFCAGAGNKTLLQETALNKVGMQLRPLKQVMVKKAGLPAIFAHAVSLGSGAKPRVTITTHSTSDGERVWYLGGNLAEAGVERSDGDQVVTAKREMRDLLPWIDLDGAEWRTLTINRAEPAQKESARPDTPFCEQAGNAIVCWPTKLTLTPLLGDEVMAKLRTSPNAETATPLPPLSALPPATPGIAPWERMFS